jgi:threonine aldolase
MKFIDLRSDTVTAPTDEMRKAMFTAEVGDDVYCDDPTTKELEKYAAELVGKEAALFVPTGTFGNQLSLFTHCERGNEVILGEDCHIVQHEVGAASVIASVQLRPISSNNGILDAAEIEKRIRKVPDIHYPQTGLICMENAHSNGKVIPLNDMKKIYETAKKYNIPVHLDGARLFNAAAYLNVDVKEITTYCDSVMFCLSKGLCAPIGSMLAGSKEFIDKARKNRKLMGGGMRQAGILAAAGLVALKDMRSQLKIDHENALYMAEELSKIPSIEVNMKDIQINMVYFKINNENISENEIIEKFYNKGIKINGMENGEMRFVTHYWVTKEDIKYTIECMKEILKQ